MSKKEVETNEPAEQSAIKNNPCGICRAMGKAGCAGHGGGSGGAGGGTDGKDQPKDKDTEKVANTSGQMNKWLQPNTVAVFDSKLLSIAADMTDTNNLRLTFQTKPDLSQEEIGLMKKYFEKIQFEFDEFKESLEAQNISTKGLSAVMEGNTLTIQMPQEHYAKFIKQLTDKNLLPSLNRSQEEKNEKEVVDHRDLKVEMQASNWKAPSPFSDISQGPRPKGWNK